MASGIVAIGVVDVVVGVGWLGLEKIRPGGEEIDDAVLPRRFKFLSFEQVSVFLLTCHKFFVSGLLAYSIKYIKI